VKSMRSARSSIWVWLTAISLGLVACGGSQDVSRPTGPVKKVAWDGSEAEPASDEPAASAEDTEKKKAESEDEEVSLGDNVIDLDAPPAKAAAKPAPSAAPPAAPPPPEAPAAAEEEEEAEEEEPVAKAEPEPEAPSNDPLAVELRKRRAQAKARSEAKKEKAPPKKKAKRAADGEVATASYKGSDPCRASSFSVPRVRDACATGGRAAAKRVMKDAIGRATATGQVLKCSSCHSNQRDYALKSDAVAELERWLEASSS
jgi:hypothetical protein